MNPPPDPLASLPDAMTSPLPPVEPVHDFVRKLRQRGLHGPVIDYVRWQAARRAALQSGTAEPAYPDLAPLSINLDLTTACNYACEHCIDLDMLNSGISHDDATLRASLLEMRRRGLRSVILIGGGEPTVHPRFTDMVRFLKELGLDVAIVSNGSRNDRIASIVDVLGPQDWVRLSLDAGTDATFQALHKPKRPIRLEEIVAGVLPWRERRPDLRIGFSFVVTWLGNERVAGEHVTENLHEMAAAARLARDHGFSYISFKPFLLRTEAGAEVMEPDAQGGPDESSLVQRLRQGLAEARQYASPDFAVVESTNLRLLLAGTWREWTHQPKTCHMQALRQVLSPLGLWNCPAHRGVPEARLDARDAYADPARVQRSQTRLVEALDAFDASVRCRAVTCLYHATNWHLEAAIADPAAFAAQLPLDGLDTFL